MYKLLYTIFTAGSLLSSITLLPSDTKPMPASHTWHAAKSIACTIPPTLATAALVAIISKRIGTQGSKNGLLAVIAMTTAITTGKLGYNATSSLYNATIGDEKQPPKSTTVEYWASGIILLSPLIIWTVNDYLPDLGPKLFGSN
jgi:hypothetical protein